MSPHEDETALCFLLRNLFASNYMNISWEEKFLVDYLEYNMGKPCTLDLENIGHKGNNAYKWFITALNTFLISILQKGI